KNYRAEKPQDLLALHNRRLPDRALTYEGLLEQWIKAAEKQNEASDRAALRQRLRRALAVEWPSEALSRGEGGNSLLGRAGQGEGGGGREGENMRLGRAGKGDRIPGVWLSGSGPAALVIHSNGSEAARATPAVAEWRRTGRPLLAIDAYQTGRAIGPRETQG